MTKQKRSIKIRITIIASTVLVLSCQRQSFAVCCAVCLLRTKKKVKKKKEKHTTHFGTDLVAALASLHVHDFTHFDCFFVCGTSVLVDSKKFSVASSSERAGDNIAGFRLYIFLRAK